MKLAVLVSGTGSILEAIMASDIQVALVVADRPCRGLEIAHAAGIPAELIERTDFSPTFDRQQYAEQLRALLERESIDLAAMAGFMTILAPTFFDQFKGQVLNTHPSLLPAFKGDHAVQDALRYGVKLTGCTIHIATPELDAGPILAQAAVPVLENDTPATLHERIKQAERTLYPQTIQTLMTKAGVV